MVAGPRPAPAPRAAPKRVLLLRHRAGGSRRLQPPADRRRAHQRHRLPSLQEPGRPKRSGKRPPRSRDGRSATAPTSSTSACNRATATRCKDIPPFYDKLIRKIKAPLMIDTTDPAAIELALTYCQGKSIINSINLEDGEEKFERICPIARSVRRGAGGRLHRRRQVAGAGLHARA